MAKPELGTKRLCAGCGAKFYDLNKDPIVCPKCSTVFVIAPSTRSRPDAVRAPVAEEEVAAPEIAEAEFVSLEEADKEVEGAKPVAVEGSDDEVEEEPLEDDVVHSRAGIHQRRRDNRERTAFFDVTGGAEKALGPL